MSKDVKKYTVLDSYTKDGLMSEGYNRWIRRNFKWVMVLMVVMVAGVWAIKEITNDGASVASYIWLGLCISAFVAGFVSAYRSALKFFNKIKDLSEPIDLREIK